MEQAIGGISIQVNPNLYPFHQIMNDLFGSNYKITEYLNDIREDKNFQILKNDSSITILNAHLANRFFKQQNVELVQDILQYFNHPPLIIAFEFYDTGDSYGYAIVKDGQLTRQVKISSHQLLIDYGNLEDWEHNWKNGDVRLENLGDDELYQTIRINSETGEESDEENLVKYGLEKNLLEHFNFDFDDFYDMENVNYTYTISNERE